MFRLHELNHLKNELARQALALYESAFPPEERLPVAQLAEELRQPAGDRQHHFWILVTARRVVGLAIFGYYRRWRLGFLRYLAIHPDHQGQGYGAWLFRHVLGQVYTDAIRLGDPPPLGLCFEVEQPEAASSEQERALRQRRIAFYQRLKAGLVETVQFTGPPLVANLPPIRCHLMFRPIAFRYGDLTPLEQAAMVELVLNQGYGVKLDDPYMHRAIAALNG